MQRFFKTLPILLACLLTACSGTNADDPDNKPIPEADGGLGPTGAVEINSFEIVEIAPIAKTRLPVTAITPDGTVFIAYISELDNLPKLGELDGEQSLLEGDWAGTRSIAMIAGEDGSLHLVAHTVASVHYIRRYPDGTFSDQQTLAAEGAGWPNIARGPNGDIAVVYVQQRPAPADGKALPDGLFVHRGVVGTSEVSFGDAVLVNPGLSEDVFRVGGATIAIGPDDAVHLVYEWSSFESVTVEYLNNKSGDYLPVEIITEAGSIPCPALTVDEGGAHITYITDVQDAAWYVEVNDEGKGEPKAIYEGEEYSVNMALMVQDGAGKQHFGVSARGEEGTELFYVHLEDGMFSSPMSAASPGSQGLTLTPSAGGSIMGPDGTLIFSYTSSGYGELAVGTE